MAESEQTQVIQPKKKRGRFIRVSGRNIKLLKEILC